MFFVNSTDTHSLIRELCESHIKMTAFAKQADRELKHNIARLFKALSFSKEVQALYILSQTGYIKDTESNINRCLNETMSSTSREDELSDGDMDFIDKFNAIEKMNSHLYSCAKDTLESKMDLNIGEINVCSKCGYTLPGDAPKECAVCHAPTGFFRTF